MFDTCVIDHTVKVPARQVGKNLLDVIEVRMRAELEGKCGPEGYVRPGSTKILHHGRGELIDIDFGKSYMFYLKVRCEICNPLPGLRFKAIVQAQNKIGVLAEGGFFDNFGNLVPVLEVVIIKDTVMLQNEVPTEELEVGDEVNVEVLGRVYELHDTRIHAFGRTVLRLDERSDFAARAGLAAAGLAGAAAGEDGAAAAADEDGSVAGLGDGDESAADEDPEADADADPEADPEAYADPDADGLSDIDVADEEDDAAADMDDAPDDAAGDM